MRLSSNQSRASVGREHGSSEVPGFTAPRARRPPTGRLDPMNCGGLVLHPRRPRGRAPWKGRVDVVHLHGRAALDFVDQLLPGWAGHERALGIQQRIESSVRDLTSIGGYAAAVETVETTVDLGEDRRRVPHHIAVLGLALLRA